MVRLGQRLHDERVRKTLTIDEIAIATKIKPKFLSAIEKGDYSRLPSPTYAQGFIKNYAEYLGLPKSEVTALFRREFDEAKLYRVLPDSLTKKQVFPRFRLRWQQQFLIIPVLLLLLVGYLVFQYRALFFPPSLILYAPKQDSIVGQSAIITGKTDSAVDIFIDNDQVSINEDGTFRKSLSLFPGKNEIVVTAKNKFGKETIVKRAVIVK